jgi:hypothetical protein
MSRKTSFVKVSGDEFKNPSFLAWISGMSKASYVVICMGGGTQINEEFAQRGFPVTQHGPLGRETETFEQRQVARDVLERNAAECEDLLAAQGIHVRVVIPVLDIGGVLCHVNGDQMVRTAYLGYDQLIIITTPEREQAKLEAFADLPKVFVLSF